MADAKLNTKKFALTDLEGADYNPRGIMPIALQGLRESLDAFGLLELPIVNIKDGKRTIVSGHQRVRAMMQEGITHADCVVVNFDLVTEMSANITMNNPAVQGEFDHVAALPTLESIDAQLPDGDMMGFDRLMSEIQDKVKPEVELRGVVGVEIDAASVETDSEFGGSYALGDNILTVCHESESTATDCVGIIRIPNEGVETYEALVEWLTLVHERAGEGCYIFTNDADFVDVVDAWLTITKQTPKWFVWAFDKSEANGESYKRQTEIVLCCGVPTPERVRVFAKREDRLPTMLVKDLLGRTENLPIFATGDGGTALLVGEGLGRSCYSVLSDPVEGDTLRKTWAAQRFGSGIDWKKETPKLP
jgi:hypothetical protein